MTMGPGVGATPARGVTGSPLQGPDDQPMSLPEEASTFYWPPDVLRPGNVLGPYPYLGSSVASVTAPLVAHVCRPIRALADSNEVPSGDVRAVSRDGHGINLSGSPGVLTTCGKGVAGVELPDPVALLRSDLDPSSIGLAKAGPAPAVCVPDDVGESKAQRRRPEQACHTKAVGGAVDRFAQNSAENTLNEATTGGGVAQAGRCGQGRRDLRAAPALECRRANGPAATDRRRGLDGVGDTTIVVAAGHPASLDPAPEREEVPASRVGSTDHDSGELPGVTARPPTRNPSTFFAPSNASEFSGVTEAPYCMRTIAAASTPASFSSSSRITAHISSPSSGLATPPAPMARAARRR